MMKFGYVFILAGIFCVTFSLQSCYYDKILPVTTDITGDVSFADDIIPIFNAACNTSGCHNAGGFSPDLSPANAYADLFSEGLINKADPEASELYQWMAGMKSIPMPVSGVNPEYNALVLAWIEQGALDN
jgi:hypothetical protein